MFNRYCMLLGLALPTPAFAETAKSGGYIPPASVVSTESTLQMLGGLILVLAIIGGITWLLKRFALLPTAATGTLKVIAATGVGQRERVVVVEIDNTWLILGVAPGRVNKLHTMDKPAPSKTDNACNDPPAEEFAVQLNQSMKKNDA